MRAHATTYRPNPVAPGSGCSIEAIELDGHPTLRVRQGQYLIGYFATVAAAAAHGVDLATAEIP